eukprot:4220196-Alexandrium_andersonii.AAC.1
MCIRDSDIPPYGRSSAQAWSPVVGPDGRQEGPWQRGPQDSHAFASAHPVANQACHLSEDLEEDWLAGPRRVAQREEGPEGKVRQ